MLIISTSDPKFCPRGYGLAGSWIRSTVIRYHSGRLIRAATAAAALGVLTAASFAAAAEGRTPFGIDYSHPERYTAQGRQTLLTRAELAELEPAILSRLSHRPAGLEQLAGVFEWLQSDFDSWNAGGATIGAVTVRELIQAKSLGGCHDFALVFAAITRLLGYPAVMVDTVGIDWINTPIAGAKARYTGHVFVEVFVDGRWILVDATNGPHVAGGYDPQNPAIPIGQGYYVMRKGSDTWGYGINSNRQLQQLMEETAEKLAGVTVAMPTYEIGNWVVTAAPRARDDQAVVVQGWPCRGKPELDPQGKIKSCTLAREHKVVGTRFPAGTVIQFSKEMPLTCTLGAEATVAGFRLPAATEVGFDLGLLRYAKLAQSLTVRGTSFPAGPRFIFERFGCRIFPEPGIAPCRRLWSFKGTSVRGGRISGSSITPAANFGPPGWRQTRRSTACPAQPARVPCGPGHCSTA